MPARVPNIGQTIRNIRRAREIVQVFASFGFDEAIQDLELDRLVLRGRRLIGLSKPDASVTRTPQAVRLREAMEELGPTFVKMAQILSTRPDLIPEDWADEFANLQSAVRAVPEDQIRPHIERLYQSGGEDARPPNERFRSIDYRAFAAGSIAQAHHAELADGTPVVLKVLRPKIEQVLSSDIEIMRTLAQFIESRFEDLGYSPVQVVEQFERQVKREVDLELERRSIARMARSFERDGRVVFPRVYAEHSRRDVLCLERVEGTLLSGADLERYSHEQREQIVRIGADVVFRQCFETGFFHADPHPGNIFVLPPAPRDDGDGASGPGGGLRLCFIDYGMTGNIDPRTAAMLADLVQGTLAGDLDRVLDVVIDLTGVSPLRARDRAFRADAWEFIARFQSASLADLQMGSLLNEFFAKVRRHGLRVPADIVYLIKAVTTIEGVGEEVCPGFDLAGHVRPHIERLLRRRYGLRAARRRLQGSLLGYAELAERAPRELSGLFHMLRSEEMTIRLSHHGLDDITRELERASRNISYALVISALLVGGAILMLADRAAASNAAQDHAGGLLFWAGVGAIALAGVLAVLRVTLRTRL